MKFISALIITALLCFAIGLFTILPWYSFVFCTLVVAVTIHQKPIKAFTAAFVAIFILWCILAFMADNANEHILSKKVAEILPLHGNYILLIILTGFVGGLLAGMGAITGSFLRKIK